MINTCKTMKTAITVSLILLFSNFSMSAGEVDFDSNGTTESVNEFERKGKNLQVSHPVNDSIDLLATSFLDFTDSLFRKLNDTGELNNAVKTKETSIGAGSWINDSSTNNISGPNALAMEAATRNFTIYSLKETRTTDVYALENKTE